MYMCKLYADLQLNTLAYFWPQDTIVHKYLSVLLTSEYGAEDVDFTLSVSHKNLALVCEGLVTWQGLYQSGAVGLEGDKDRFDEVAGLFWLSVLMDCIDGLYWLPVVSLYSENAFFSN